MNAAGPFAVTVRRPVAILMVTVAAVVFGAFSYRLLPVELMPDVSYPSLTVRTEYAGAAPQEVEENVTRPVEEALGVVGGLVRMSSISRAGLSDVTLEFTWDTEMSQSWQEVTERLDTLFLPEDADKPLILRYDPQLEPVLRLALASSLDQDQGPSGLRRLRAYAEDTIKRRLEQVEGVAAVRVLGGLEEQVAVDLDEEALRRTGLSIQEVARRLEAENVNLAGGDLKEGETQYLVRTVNEFEALDEIAGLVVARVGGRDVRVRDVGTVRWGWADRKVITRLGQREAVELEIQKEADANVVAMAAAVRARLEGDAAARGIASDLPAGWQLDVVGDRSTFIEASVREVRDTALLGGILAVLVLYLFLRDFRMTAVVAVAIPVSVAAVFAPMNLSGLTLNIMSLGGLALGIGMLVDSGIVVIESIARCREEGDDPTTAVVRGTSEVGTAVIASTLTTVAVFFPMVFVEGVAGQVFADLALTVVYALLASLLVAIFLVPALAARSVASAGRASTPVPRDLLRRLKDAVRYRSLGPLSEDDGARAPRWLRPALWVLPPFAVLALPFVLRALSAGLTALTPSGGAGRGGPPGGFAGPPPAPESAAGATGGPWIYLAAPGLALLAIVVVANLVLRLRAPRRSTKLAALPMVPIDAVLALLESAWLILVWAVALVGGTVFVVGRVLGAAARVLLWPLVRAFDVAFSAIQTGYPALLRSALRARAPLLVGATAALALSAWALTRLDTALIPEVHQGEFDVEVALPVGTPLEETLREVAPLEAWALADPRIERVLVQVGADPDADAAPEEGEHTARVSMRLAPEPEPDGTVARVAGLARRIAAGLGHAGVGGAVAIREEDVVRDVRAQLRGLADVEAKITRPVLFSFRTPIEVEVEAYDLDTLRRLGESVREAMAAIPFLTDVKTTARAGSPEVQISYDRDELVRRGLDVREVAEAVRTKIRGSSATEYRKRERRIDVVVRLAQDDRATVRQLRNLVVNPGGAVPIPLSAVADVRIAAGPADIRRVGQTRVAIVQANLAGGGLGRAGEEIRARLDRLDWPDGTTWRLAGQVQEMQRSLASLWIALGLSVFLVYVVMASQFESLLHPLLIMVTVPLALVGVVAVLVWLAVPLSVVVFLGMIMLAGIVVNNAIVLVDYVNRLRRRGRPLEEALIEAGSARLRPILMTTATTVLGLVPMSLGLGDGAEIRTPMALTVIAGLVSSTLLTLIVLPVLYAAVESLLPGRARQPRGEVAADGAVRDPA